MAWNRWISVVVSWEASCCYIQRSRGQTGNPRSELPMPNVTMKLVGGQK